MEHCKYCKSGDFFDDGDENDCRCPMGCHVIDREVDYDF